MLSPDEKKNEKGYLLIYFFTLANIISFVTIHARSTFFFFFFKKTKLNNNHETFPR